ncbi:hypothetical protein WICPIJ_005709 [Wickerhamomyces pijperi]|uniref:Stationary phase protein 4 n=1 Tax=Wickerhamomyces pijperi TaxID=599730 RepID=A0A9P8TKV7_WICPI|nr:hypothetical protein WICPIJ_005709 [Wickerhamomyces pijperi]
MSGIFDKYLNMLNTGSYRHGGGGGSLSGKGRTNANKTLTQINGRDVYIPYDKKSRRSSSVDSTNSEVDLKELKEMAFGKNGVETDEAIKITSSPNNRVNF